MKKIILSGGPHTGKTTLIEGLRGIDTGLHFVDEPAALIIQAELDRAAREPSYEPIVPTQRYDAFVGLVVRKSVELESQIPPHADTALLDRSLIDNIGYARLNGRLDLVSGIQRHVQRARYTGAIICDFVGVYTQTAIRPESEEFAQSIHKHIVDAYEEADLPVVHLPALPVEERLEAAMEAIESFRR